MSNLIKIKIKRPNIKRTSYTSSVTKEPFYVLQEAITFYFKGFLYTIPKGFVTDLATIPWWIEWLFSHRHKDIILASIVHDYLTHQRVLMDRIHNGSAVDSDKLEYMIPITQKEVDDVFYDIMVMDGMCKIRAFLMYLGPRINFTVLKWLGIGYNPK